MRRVVITGLGAVTPLGADVDSTWQGVKAGACGIGPITAFDTTEFKVSLAAEVKPFNMDAYLTPREQKFNDRFTQFARIAAKQAMQDANFDEQLNRKRLGVIIGSGIGGVQSIEVAKTALIERGPTRISPYFIPMALINLGAGSVAIDHQALNYCSSVVTACAAGSNAIGDAFHKIKNNLADVMIAGGSEASITPLAIGGFMVMRALNESTDPKRASIPFDAERSGFVMGEGAAVLILEELEHAQKRGAKIYGEIVGYGATCDANHVTAPIEDGSGAADAMTMAIEEAGLKPSAIDYINAHGTSTPLNDKTETKAVHRAFGEHAKSLMMSSTKSMMGHLLGASGAVEALICLKALQEGFVPATINYQTPDSECDLDIVANQGRLANLSYVLSNSLGFGGHNASLCFKKWENT